MSGEVLRQAAALMRERALAALADGCRDLWAAGPTIDPDNNGWYVCEQRQLDVDWDTTVAHLPYDYEGLVARHLAPWHPAVALEVAALLQYVADADDWLALPPGVTKFALAVAHAYLGTLPQTSPPP